MSKLDFESHLVPPHLASKLPLQNIQANFIDVDVEHCQDRCLHELLCASCLVESVHIGSIH